jgi:hypothetical protein
MRFGLLLCTVAGFLLLSACGSDATSSRSHAGADSSTTPAAPRDTLTLTGTLIDATCHAQHEADASRCEGTYVRKGYPVGLKTGHDRSSVWILITVPQALGDYLTATARVTGVVRSDGVLIPHRMEVHDGAEWTTVM